MAIERIYESDSFGRFEGYFIRQTDVHSVATTILEPGGTPETIAKLDEHHFAVYHKEPFKESVCEEVYDDYDSALQALRGFIEDEEEKRN